MVAFFYCIHLILIVLIRTIFASRVEARLLFNLLKQNYYDHRVRPVEESNATLNVELGLTVRRIINLSYRSNSLTMNVWLTQRWKDSQLTWKPEDYAGIKEIFLPRHQIFTPDITILNGAEQVIDSSMMSRAVVKFDGTVKLVDQLTWKSDCVFEHIETEVRCTVKLGSWSYNSALLNLTVGEVDVMTSVMPHRQWLIEKASTTRLVRFEGAETDNKFSIDFVFYLRKRADADY
uniref:Neurotransmitter-gated ion-channel ligand-binding domain-containing protein n=1 Tax=Plectus sambesii TaxID=2011161 RepID=A0A914VMM0_9BILA